MPATLVRASDLPAAIADGPRPGDVIEVEAGSVNIGSARWPAVRNGVQLSGDFMVRAKNTPVGVLGPEMHRAAGMPVKVNGSLSLSREVHIEGLNLDSRILGDFGPGTLLLSGACDVAHVRVSSWGIAVTVGQFSDRAKAVRIRDMRLEEVGRPGARAKFHQSLYLKAIDRGGCDLEDVLIYDVEAYTLHFYPNSVGTKARRIYSWDTAWGIIYSGEIGNASTGGGGKSDDNEVYASIVGGLRGNAAGSRRAIESWWNPASNVGVGNLFAQGSYVGGASGSGYAIRDSLQVAPKRLNPAVPGDYRQDPTSPTANIGPLQLRPGGVVPSPPPSEEPPVVIPPTTPDTAGPTMAWVQPAAGAVLKGAFSYTATAADPSGIAWVEFRLRDSSRGIDQLLFRELSAPWGETPFDTTRLPDGPYSLIAVGRDKAGNETTILRPVVIANAPPAPDPEPDPEEPDPDPDPVDPCAPIKAERDAALMGRVAAEAARDDARAALAREQQAHGITAGERDALIDQVTRIRRNVSAEALRHGTATADALEG